MGWRDLLQAAPSQGVFTWLGGRRIYDHARTYRVEGQLPREFGWYLFSLAGRIARLLKPAERDNDYLRSLDRFPRTGYLVGDRFIPVNARVSRDPAKLLEQTEPVYLVEEGLDRFPLVETITDRESRTVFVQQTFPGPADDAVREAFIARKESVDDIPHVTPALDLAFGFATHQRKMYEERREELRKIREENERKEAAFRRIGTAAGRREAVAFDLETAVRSALAMGGAELLDVRDGNRGQAVVTYRFENRRFECVCDRWTLRIIDAGICLEDHLTGERGDTRFTLESLPGVVREAINGRRLHVYRHIDDEEDD
jgi:hypothetical protein